MVRKHWLCRVLKANSKQLINHVKIDNTVAWQRNHWRSIESAYNRSAFFEYYKDDLKHLFDTKYEFIYGFNMATFQYLCKQFKIVTNISVSDSYKVNYGEVDFRNLSNENVYSNITYRQVFMYKHAFVPYTSALDLLFNLGPQSHTVLTSSLPD
jgi:hypothetical protein